MTMFIRLLSMLALFVLSACGGGGASTSAYGGDAGGGSGGGGSTPTGSASDIVLVLASDTIANSSSTTVAVTATALDANRNALPGVAMSMSADSEAILTLSGTSTTVTDSAGQLVGALSIGSNHTNRVITVTATSGSVTKTAQLTVVTSPAAAKPTSIELIASSTSVGTGGDQVTIQAFVKDATNNALPSAAVAFSTTTGTLSSASTATDASGTASANFSAGGDKSNRTATITVASGTIQAQLSLPITGTKLTAAGPSSLILGNSATYTVQVVDSQGKVLSGVAVAATSALSNALTAPGGLTTDANGQVQFTYAASVAGADQITFKAAGFTAAPLPVTISGVDFVFISPAASTTVAVNTSQALQVRLRQGGVAVANQIISFTATGGTLSASTATTDASGVATVSLSSLSAGPVTVQATLPGASPATASLPLVIVATTPAKLVLQVTPSALAPNAGSSTTNQAQVIAKVTDAAGNPVYGVTVNFSRDLDPSGGNLLQPSADTDQNGQATVNYVAGAESTANNGVVLKATVASNAAVFGTASLTVNQTALFISLGTGNTITNVDTQTYKKDWVVYVTDANGVAVNGVALTIKVLPLHYLLGNLVLSDDVWIYSSPIRVCRNEDTNGNGILDAGEDYNSDGVLWPGNVISVTPGNVVTDGSGRATVSLIYAESFAPWVNVRLTASATVSGTESRRDADFIVPGSAADFTKAGGPPAGVISPFGLYKQVSANPALCADYPTLP